MRKAPLQLEIGPGFVSATPCRGCGHVRCAELCPCDCDAIPAYERPKITPIGNLNDVLAYVCAGSECDSE